MMSRNNSFKYLFNVFKYRRSSLLQLSPLHQILFEYFACFAVQQFARRTKYGGKRQAARQIAQRLAQVRPAEARHTHSEAERLGLKPLAHGAGLVYRQPQYLPAFGFVLLIKSVQQG